nr:NO-inducible flavohemoprotein [Azospirillum sp. SYSU D00513]
MTQAQTDIIKATAPVVAEHAVEITSTFYPILFEKFPEVRAVFNQSHQRGGTQPQALANAIIAYASNIDRLDALKPALRCIVEKHVSLNITPDQYKAVGSSLMEAIGRVLGDAVTPDVADAWGAAYWQLADILIAAEDSEYSRKAALPGGWRGARRMRLVEKTPESAVITSFRFAPADGGPVMDFLPGQYLGVRLSIDGETVHRNYSLSDSPDGRTYRISVKREPGGVASNFLHNRLAVGGEIDVYPPAGEFVLQPGEADVLLVTAGVGQTPALPLARQALADGRRVRYLHAALNGTVHAFRGSVEGLAQAGDFRQVICYSEPQPGDRPDATGFVTPALLAGLLEPGRRTDAYVVGPKPFMACVLGALKELGVPQDRVFYEFFGPGEALVQETPPMRA